MGENDVAANIAKIKEVSGNSKVSYVGYSQGTSQMLYGLSKGKDFGIDKAILLAPCLGISSFGGMAGYESLFPKLRTAGINLLAGPTSAADIARVCDIAKAKPDYAAACTYMQGVAYFSGSLPLKSMEQFG